MEKTAALYNIPERGLQTKPHGMSRSNPSVHLDAEGDCVYNAAHAIRE